MTYKTVRWAVGRAALVALAGLAVAAKGGLTQAAPAPLAPPPPGPLVPGELAPKAEDDTAGAPLSTPAPLASITPSAAGSPGALTQVTATILCGTNADPRYSAWPKLFPTDPYTRIPVFIDSMGYSSRGMTMVVTKIRAAMGQMNTDLNGVIQFIELPTLSPASGRDFIYISPTNNAGEVQPICSTPPGRVVGQNTQGQKMFIVPDSVSIPNSGCDTVRGIMAQLTMVLGRRPESLRPDRLININPAAIPTPALLNLWTPYSTGSAQGSYTPYDYCSITHASPTAYATVGQTAYTYVPPQPALPNGPTMARLSLHDCQAISAYYGASGQQCVDPGCY